MLELADKLGLEKKYLKVEVKNLSGGIRRLVSIVLTLIGDANLLVFDEPTSGLDRKCRNQVWEIMSKIKSRDRAILITT